MSKFIVKFNRDKCKGCELCANACPKKIIAMQPAVNRLGYRPAGVAAELMEQCIREKRNNRSYIIITPELDEAELKELDKLQLCSDHPLCVLYGREKKNDLD